MTGQPIYMYRLIFPFDDKILNVGTDMDFNLEGEFKHPVSENAHVKGEFVVSGVLFLSIVTHRASFSLEINRRLVNCR